MLINDILDLSRSNRAPWSWMSAEVRLEDLHSFVERTFRHVAEAKSVDFHIWSARSCPRRSSRTPSACSRFSEPAVERVQFTHQARSR